MCTRARRHSPPTRFYPTFSRDIRDPFVYTRALVFVIIIIIIIIIVVVAVRFFFFFSHSISHS
jgi:flagellar basal body-associated protein FliL